MKKILNILIFLSICIILNGCAKKLTDVELDEMVSIKGVESLTWEDFKSFKFQEDKSFGLVRIYTLDNGTTLILSGDKDSIKPHTISLVEIDGRLTYLKNNKN